jgi:hypothetical protein
MTFYINSNSGYCSISLSENENKESNKVKETNKFIIRNLFFSMDYNLVFQKVSFDMEETKLTTITKINNSVFCSDLIFPIRKQKTENFKIEYFHVFNETIKVVVNIVKKKINLVLSFNNLQPEICKRFNKISTSK